MVSAGTRRTQRRLRESQGVSGGFQSIQGGFRGSHKSFKHFTGVPGTFLEVPERYRESQRRFRGSHISFNISTGAPGGFRVSPGVSGDSLESQGHLRDPSGFQEVLGCLRNASGSSRTTWRSQKRFQGVSGSFTGFQGHSRGLLGTSYY